MKCETFLHYTEYLSEIWGNFPYSLFVDGHKTHVTYMGVTYAADFKMFYWHDIPILLECFNRLIWQALDP
nr:unnamed protein product [Callosobruchus analis]